MTTKEQIVAEARTWLGTPWLHQHCTKGIAVDCAQLVIGVARELKIGPSGFVLNDYGREPNGTIMRLCAEHFDRIGLADLQPGDVVVVAVDKQPQHMGIVANYVHGGLSIVHASSTGTRQVIETRLVFGRGFRFIAAFRFREVH